MRLSRNLMGVGDLVPSQPALPFWPSGSGMGDLVGSQPGPPFWPSSGGMGDLVGSQPGYPFWPSSGGMGSCGGDCGCGGKCGGGMGAISDDLSGMFSNLTSGQFSAAWGNFTSAMGEPVFGMPLWVVGGGALLAYVYFFSGGAKHSRYQRARRSYASARAAYA